MARPRHVLPGKFYMLTRRCAQRQFLLRPDEKTNSAFVYCLGEAAQRFKIDILLPMAASNHHHTIFFDRHGRYPQFVEHFHKMLARCQNARWGRWENLWAAEEPCITELLDRETIVEKLAYAASNPVKDLLVERATQWPGINGYRELIHGRTLRATRPRHFFRGGGSMPEEIDLALVIPPELGRAETVIDELRARVADIEHATKLVRAETGKGILGRARVLEQPWHGAPHTKEPRRNMRPRFAGLKELRNQAIAAFHDFLAAYRTARQSWMGGAKTLFPSGTYWLARFAPIAVAPLPASSH